MFRHLPSKRIDMWTFGDFRGERSRAKFRPFVKAARRGEERDALRLEMGTAAELAAWPVICCDGECYECSGDCAWCLAAACRGCAPKPALPGFTLADFFR
jgi:hypothetical protein